MKLYTIQKMKIIHDHCNIICNMELLPKDKV